MELVESKGLREIMSVETINAKLLPRFEADGFVAVRQFVRGDESSELVANVGRFVKQLTER